MKKITEGYTAFNGHVFTAAEAEVYNRECEKAAAFPTDWNLDNRHRLFCIIIGLGKPQDFKHLPVCGVSYRTFDSEAEAAAFAHWAEEFTRDHAHPCETYWTEPDNGKPVIKVRNW